VNTIAVVANAPFASAIAATCRETLGDGAVDVHFLDIDFTETATASEERVSSFIASLPKQDGLLILTDLFGATPDNLARSSRCDVPHRVVSGVNLAMLLRACNYSSRQLEELESIALEGGQRGIRASDA
jgi:PTS system ascorbate-specific IIA component